MTQIDEQIDNILLEHIVLATDNGQPYIKSTDTAVEAIKALISDQVAKARIDELIGVRGWTEYEPDPKYSPAERFHIVPYTYLTNRIAELNGVKE